MLRCRRWRPERLLSRLPVAVRSGKLSKICIGEEELMGLWVFSIDALAQVQEIVMFLELRVQTAVKSGSLSFRVLVPHDVVG